MHVHATRPACFSETEGQPFDHAFRESGRFCYIEFEQVMTHDRGCLGCCRAKDERINEALTNVCQDVFVSKDTQ